MTPVVFSELLWTVYSHFKTVDLPHVKEILTVNVHHTVCNHISCVIWRAGQLLSVVWTGQRVGGFRKQNFYFTKETV